MDHLRHPTQDAQQQIQQALRLCPLFADWPPARVAELAAASRLRRYPRRTLFDVRGSERKDVLVVASGSIEVVTTNASGDKYILAVLGPGQVTKLVLLLERVPMLFGCHAREDAEIVHVPGAVLRQVLDAEPMLWRGLALFMLPYFLFSAIAGQLSDKYDKATVARWVKLFDLAAMVFGGLSLYLQNPVMHLIVLFLAGTTAAFFGPLKYGVLPQYLKREELIAGNALIEKGKV